MPSVSASTVRPNVPPAPSGFSTHVVNDVSAALTNRQIADRLVLSERTVESHVRNILAKLGVANRTEIAAVTLASRA